MTNSRCESVDDFDEVFDENVEKVMTEYENCKNICDGMKLVAGHIAHKMRHLQGNNYKWDDFNQGYQLTKTISLKFFSYKLLVHYVDYNL